KRRVKNRAPAKSHARMKGICTPVAGSSQNTRSKKITRENGATTNDANDSSNHFRADAVVSCDAVATAGEGCVAIRNDATAALKSAVVFRPISLAGTIAQGARTH